jgi:hypothetical protein
VNTTALRRVCRAYLLSIAVWGGLSLLTGWQFRIFDKELNIQSSLFDMLLLAEARGFTLALLTPPIFYVVSRQLAQTWRLFWSIGLYCAGVAPFMMVYAGIHWVVLPPWDARLQRYVSRAGHSPLELIRNGFADLITMYIAIVVAAHAYEYFERIRKQELERYDFQRALAASELQTLKMQLHPHFLFNTLHGISTLIDSDPKNAKAMILRLSNLLHTALRRDSSDLIPLQEELKFIGEYLDLEKMRLGARLKVDWIVSAETRELLVPQMILQPLVENAIRHGIACAREGGWIEIACRRNNGTFELQVRNSVGGRRAAGTGVGLRNTEARLKYLYSEEAAFSFALTDAGIATATIALPALSAHPILGESSGTRRENVEQGERQHARVDS